MTASGRCGIRALCVGVLCPHCGHAGLYSAHVLYAVERLTFCCANGTCGRSFAVAIVLVTGAREGVRDGCGEGSVSEVPGDAP